MANHYTDIDKWDDDWFIKLPPRLKCAWQYLCDNVGGCGEMKFSLAKLIFHVGEPISLDEFKLTFGGRIAWLSDDELWVPGTTWRIYKTLSPKIPAHINAAKKIIRLTAGIDMFERGAVARARFESFLNSISTASPPDQALPRAQPGPDLKEKREERKDLLLLGEESLREESLRETPPAKEKLGPLELANIWNRQMATARSIAGKPMPLVDSNRLKPSSPRWKAAVARLRDDPDPNFWADVFERISRSPFCRGKGAQGDWLANFDFAIRPDVATGVLEGQFGCTVRPSQNLPPSQRPEPPPEPEQTIEQKREELEMIQNQLRGKTLGPFRQILEARARALDEEIQQKVGA